MADVLQPGDLVERYRVEAVLGRGGQASVYRVRHESLGTQHALKVLETRRGDLRARLMAEGRLQASLEHPNILAVRDVLDVDGEPGLLMDLVAGGSLADYLAATGAQPLPRLRAFFDPILAGVAHAHARGMIHRDLKPQNILLARIDGKLVPKIADFGLAKVLGEFEGGTRTQEGVAMGTPSYMAPEQVFDAARADRRADMWALGAILFELATGVRAFTGRTGLEIIRLVTHGTYPDPVSLRADVDPSVVAAIRACLVVDPNERVADCAALRALLGGAEPPPPGLAPIPSPAARTRDTDTVFLDAGASTREDPNAFIAPPVNATMVPGTWDDLDTAADLPDPMSEPTPGPAAHAEPTTEFPLFDDAVAAPTPATQLQPTTTVAPTPPTPPATPTTLVAPPTARARPGLRWAALALPALVAWTDLTSPLEAQLTWPLLAAVRGRLPVDDVVVVAFDGVRDPRGLREQHPAVLRALADAGATAILFDVALLASTEHDDAIAAAVADLGARGVPVVLPAFPDGAGLPESAALRAGPLGLVEFQHELLTGAVVRAPMLRRTVEGATYWHAAAQVAHAHAGARKDIALDGADLVLGALRNPTWAGLAWLHPFGDVPRVAYEHPEAWGDAVRGKVVVLGSLGGSADLHRTPDGPRYGVEIQAALVQTLLRQAALTVAPLGLSGLVAGATGLATAAARTWASGALALVAPALAIAVGIALLSAGIVVPLVPVVLAGVVGWWAGARRG